MLSPLSASDAVARVWSTVVSQLPLPSADYSDELDEEQDSALLGFEPTVAADGGMKRRQWRRDDREASIVRTVRLLVPVVLLSFFVGAVTTLAVLSAHSTGYVAAPVSTAGVEEAKLQGGDSGNSTSALAAAAASLLVPLAAAGNVSTCTASTAPAAVSVTASTPTVFNFTVDSILPPSRWPKLIDPLQARAAPRALSSASSSVSSAAADSEDGDPFALFSAGRFNSSVRGVVISMFTPGMTAELLTYFADNDRLLLSPMSSHSDYVIFHTLFPSSSGDELHAQLLGALGCEELTFSNNLTARRPDVSDIYARLRHPSLAYPLYLPAVREFLSPLGTHILTVPVAVNLPAHVAADAGQLLRPDWMGCMGVRRSLDYALFSGAVFPTQLIFHPLLRGYDYFIKLDLDIGFVRLPPASVFRSMQAQQCVWMHTQYNSGSEDCELDGAEAVADWANRTHHMAAASAQHSWWSSLHYFYGNFIGGWLGWLSSAENHQLATHLYEDTERPGYFSHRWGDQPPFAKMVGMWFNLNDQQVRGTAPAYAAAWTQAAINATASNATVASDEWKVSEQVVSAVCDFTYLRHVAFEHH